MVPKHRKHPFAFCTLMVIHCIQLQGNSYPVQVCPFHLSYSSLFFLFTSFGATTHTLLHAALCQSDMFMMRGECGWDEGNISMLDSVDSDHMLIFLFSLKRNSL